MMTPEQAYLRCIKENKKISELEGIISNDYYYSYLYALHVIEGPFEKGEKEISKHPYWSFHYTRDIIKRRWERGEEVISKNSHYSYYYARDIIQEPFEKCHPIIFNSEYKNNYMNFLKSKKYELNKISEWLI